MYRSWVRQTVMKNVQLEWMRSLFLDEVWSLPYSSTAFLQVHFSLTPSTTTVITTTASTSVDSRSLINGYPVPLLTDNKLFPQPTTPAPTTPTTTPRRTPTASRSSSRSTRHIRAQKVVACEGSRRSLRRTSRRKYVESDDGEEDDEEDDSPSIRQR